MLKLALYGLSGAGKSTTSLLLGRLCVERGIDLQVFKIAEPLYLMQQELYTMVGRKIAPYQQDQILLRVLAGEIRRIAPSFLADDFLRRVDQSAAEVVVNDDLKDVDVDYPKLAAAGFRFVKVACDEETRLRRLANREDLAVAPETVQTWRFDRIRPDWEIDNTEEGEAALTRKLYELFAREWGR